MQPTAAAKPAYGLQPLHLDGQRDGLLYVPPVYTPERPAAMALMLHGAGGAAAQGMELLQPLADAAGLILLAPAARSSHSWDIISQETFGQDVVFINAALSAVFSNYAIDPKRVAIGGFSDGASYALSLGLINGALFTHIIAFSPGFAFAPDARGFMSPTACTTKCCR